MINLFFYSDKQFEDVAGLIFTTLGMANYLEGESSNVKGGYYYSYSVFGLEIKLEQNSYDYEDQYNYMLHIKKHSVNPYKTDFYIDNTVAGIILRLLYNNLNIPIAIEIGNQLILVSQENISEITQSML